MFDEQGLYQVYEYGSTLFDKSLLAVLGTFSAFNFYKLWVTDFEYGDPQYYMYVGLGAVYLVGFIVQSFRLRKSVR